MAVNFKSGIIITHEALAMCGY